MSDPRDLGLVDLVVLGDAIVRHHQELPAFTTEVEQHLASRKRVKHRPVERALDLVRADVDSPMETRLRLLLVLAGLPCPITNYQIRNRLGETIGDFDLVYPEQKIVLEYDGDDHRESKTKWRNDEGKRDLLRRLDYLVLPVRADGIYVEPETTLQRAYDALAERRHPELPERLDPEWCKHFSSNQQIAEQLRMSWFDDPVELSGPDGKPYAPPT